MFYYTSQVDSLTIHRPQLRFPQITSPLTQFFNKGKHSFTEFYVCLSVRRCICVEKKIN